MTPNIILSMNRPLHIVNGLSSIKSLTHDLSAIKFLMEVSETGMISHCTQKHCLSSIPATAKNLSLFFHASIFVILTVSLAAVELQRSKDEGGPKNIFILFFFQFAILNNCLLYTSVSEINSRRETKIYHNCLLYTSETLNIASS